MENPRSPSKLHPGWTLILIALFLLVLTLTLVFTHLAPASALLTLLLPTLSLTGVGVVWLRNGKTR